MRVCIATFCLIPFLAACGDNKARFVIPSGPDSEEIRLRVGSIEVRDVSLPAYASASEILVEDAEGALRPVSKAIWADEPARAVTSALARSLDVKSTASVAAEPWPLTDGPAVRVAVLIEQMIARTDGNFVLSGQFALSSPSGAIREKLQRFEIMVPMPDSAPGAVAASAGKAIDRLASEILAALRA